MTRSALFVAAVLLILGTGCASSRPQAGTDVAAPTSSTKAAGPQYMVEMRVIEIAADGSTRVISEPQILLAPGQQGKIEIAGDAQEPSAVLTARVTRAGT
jgi:Flp pilus assembly secretin CpaC